MNTYEVTWWLSNGNTETQEYIAERMEIHPTGPAVFFNMVKSPANTIHLVDGQNQPPPQVEMVGSVTGYSKIVQK